MQHASLRYSRLYVHCVVFLGILLQKPCECSECNNDIFNEKIHVLQTDCAELCHFPEKELRHLIKLISVHFDWGRFQKSGAVVTSYQHRRCESSTSVILSNVTSFRAWQQLELSVTDACCNECDLIHRYWNFHFQTT